MSYGADNDILWEYMDRLRWRLRRLPEEQTADILREIRQHMQELVAGYEAEGRSPAEAVRMAEEKFGSAEAVGNRILWTRRRPSVYVIVCFLLYLFVGPRMTDPRMNWQEVILAAGVGTMIGQAFVYKESFIYWKLTWKRRTMRHKIAAVLAYCAVAGFGIYCLVTALRATAIHTLVLSGVIGVTAILTTFCVRAFRKSRPVRL